jgi:predicted dienelactone hydrolase
MPAQRTRIILSSIILSVMPCVALAGQTGLKELSLADPAGGRETTGFVWDPAADKADTVLALGNAVWEPIRVAPDADPVPGSYPLVVLSHGMFGNARNQAWLAEGLVAAGFIVAAADQPGTSTFQRDPDQRRELWERPRDVSRVIDTVLDDPQIGPTVDANRIYMAGHSLGGFTAMLLAGARFDPGRIDAFCTSHPDDHVCNIFSDWGVAKTPEDRVAMSGDLSDPRIRAFAVFDLGGTQSLSLESLGAVTRPVLVYGAPVDIEGLDLDVESRALVAALPSSSAIYHEPATMAHFDFLGVCTDRAIDILQQEEPDDVYVCEDGREDRKAEHRQIIAEVTDFFQVN